MPLNEDFVAALSLPPIGGTAGFAVLSSLPLPPAALLHLHRRRLTASDALGHNFHLSCSSPARTWVPPLTGKTSWTPGRLRRNSPHSSLAHGWTPRSGSRPS